MVDIFFSIVSINPISLISLPVMTTDNLFHLATFLTDESYRIDLLVFMVTEYSFD